MSNDYLPKKDAELVGFTSAFSAKITADPASYGLVAGDATQISGAVSNFVAKYAAATDPATRVESAIAAKDAAKNTLTAIVRGYAMMIKRNRSVTDEAKIDLGIGAYDCVSTPVPAPTSFPVINVLGATPRQHEIHFSDSAADKKGRPAGTAGLILFCQTADPKDPPPADASGADFRALVTKSVFTMDFPASDVGKRAYYFARWHTARGLLGPWSLMASMTVAG